MYTIKKHINADSGKKGIQVTIQFDENNININIDKMQNLGLTFNQLCSLNKVIETIIDKHYQAYASSMEKEKTHKIFFDDPINW
jgi:hypothetical protein